MKDTTSAGDALRALGGALGRLYQPLQCPKRTIWLNRSALRLAPPTSAPSISSSAISSAMLDGVTEPPYWTRTRRARSAL